MCGATFVLAASVESILSRRRIVVACSIVFDKLDDVVRVRLRSISSTITLVTPPGADHHAENAQDSRQALNLKGHRLHLQ